VGISPHPPAAQLSQDRWALVVGAKLDQLGCGLERKPGAQLAEVLLAAKASAEQAPALADGECHGVPWVVAALIVLRTGRLWKAKVQTSQSDKL
jgi:hypothetical protein